MTKTMIDVRGATCVLGGIPAVNELNLKIETGEFFSLLGPSGCGKSTFLRMMAGFREVHSGSIFIDGHDMTGVPPNKRPLNTVFQSYAIFPHLNVLENVAYGLRPLGLTSEQSHKKAIEALAMVRLSDFANRMPSSLSGGQQQRVALARALVREPKVLLLDEPLSALDKNLREEMQTELRQLQRRVGITFVMVTHDQEEALALSDRVAVMFSGRILQIDTPSRLYERPKSRQVGSFLGKMNFLEGRVERIEKETAIVSFDQTGSAQIEIDPELSLKANDAITVGIRPEKFTVELNKSTEAKTKKRNQFSGQIVDHVYGGNITQLSVRVNGQNSLILVSCNSGSVAGLIDSNPNVQISFTPESATILSDITA
jgi:spermidine/putrescine transport system ATP-binding protein